MRPDELLQALSVAGRLKTRTRHCWLEDNRKESVADHSWRITLMVMMLEQEPEFQDVDMNKVMRMCLIHDIGESFTGDIPAFEKSEEDEEGETAQYQSWLNTFPEKDQAAWSSLLAEMHDQKTKEARVYKALDKLEALISHNESDIHTWLPLEYDLQKTYGQEQMSASPYFAELRKLVDEWTERKIEETRQLGTQQGGTSHG